MYCLNKNNTLSEKYVKQASSKPLDFILKAIDLTEECSFRYKISKNQRLLVEICLMKLCSISQIEPKKKIVIPHSDLINKKKSIHEELKKTIKEKKELTITKPVVEERQEELIKEIKNERIISGLSLSLSLIHISEPTRPY